VESVYRIRGWSWGIRGWLVETWVRVLNGKISLWSSWDQSMEFADGVEVHVDDSLTRRWEFWMAQSVYGVREFGPWSSRMELRYTWMTRWHVGKSSEWQKIELDLHMHTDNDTHAHTRTQTYVRARTHTCTHTHTHTYTHTHTHTRLMDRVRALSWALNWTHEFIRMRWYLSSSCQSCMTSWVRDRTRVRENSMTRWVRGNPGRPLLQ